MDPSNVVIFSIAVLFALTAAEGFCILALFRQVGLLHLALEREDGVHAERTSSVPPLANGTALADISGISRQGNVVSLDQLTGRRVLLAFVHPLCKPCNEIAPELEAAKRDQDLRTEIVVVSDADQLSTEAYVTEHRLSMPVLFEPRADFNQPAPLLRALRVPRTPFAYLLDEQHRILTSGTIGSKDAFWRVARGFQDAPPSVPHLEAVGTT